MRRYVVPLLLLIPVLAFAGVTTLSSKQPFEELTETVDFSNHLPNYNVTDNGVTTSTVDNVASCTVIARDMAGNNVDNTVVGWDNSMISGQTVKVIRKGGTDGKKYKITLRCTSDNGVKVEHDLIFMVQEQ